jgi:hypothetical protein
MKDNVYTSVNEIPTINYGNHDCFLDIDALSVEADILLSSNTAKSTGSKNQNTFIKLPTATSVKVRDYLNEHVSYCDWTVEYFKSCEPAGLHTDYHSVDNVWMQQPGIQCHLLIGVIIPLEWNCKQPYTINYDRVTTVPRKLLYRRGEMRYLDNDEIVVYRNSWNYDNEVLKYNPHGTLYAKEYADLKIHSAYKWKLGTMTVFDTRRWHSSSWFLSSDRLQEDPVEFKKSIIAFGSYNVKK